jgi:hypothetical protein
MKIVFYCTEKEPQPRIVGLREAKRLLKEEGGEAWIEHWVRDDLVSSEPVSLDSNKAIRTASTRYSRAFR